MSKQLAPKGMYTSKQAREIMGVSATVFYGLVKEGVIKKVVHPGRTEGFYPTLQVDNYTRQVQAINQSYTTELDFGLALIEDLPSVFELVANVSGGPNHAVPEEILKAWIRKNPQSVHVLRRRNEIVGYVSGFILPMGTLLLRLDGTLLNREIPIDDIQPFDATPKAVFYIAEMAVKPSLRSTLEGKPTPDDHLGLLLIRHTARFILGDLKRQGVMVSELYTVGSSEFGIKMCKKLSMHPMALSKGVRVDRMPCRVSVNEVSESPIINRMIKRLKIVA
jgi:hypothetical protein